MDWDQSAQPFSSSLKKYIENINIEEDMNNLCQNIKLRNKCLKNFRISNLLLKIGVAKNLTLRQIGRILYREGLDEIPSVVENLVEKASKINSLFLQRILN